MATQTVVFPVGHKNAPDLDLVRQEWAYSGRVRLRDFELDLKTGEFCSGDDSRTLLREQPFQVLRMLVAKGSEIVTREEIRRTLWPGSTIVDFDHSINVAIGILRKALGDSANNPQYIETLARRGYRLMVPVEWLQPPRETTGRNELAAKPPKRWWKAAIVGAFALILVVAGYMSWRNFRPVTPTASGRIRLAVLPFQNLTGDPNKEYLADGLTEQMISQLGRLNSEQLGVTARTSVMGYKHKDVRLDQIGRDLSVQYVLENSLRESGDHLRLTAQLIQVKDQTHLWSQDYDYRAQDILTLQDDVGRLLRGKSNCV